MEGEARAQALALEFVGKSGSSDDSIADYVAGVLCETMPVDGPPPDDSAVADFVEVVEALLPELGDRAAGAVRQLVDDWLATGVVEATPTPPVPSTPPAAAAPPAPPTPAPVSKAEAAVLSSPPGGSSSPAAPPVLSSSMPASRRGRRRRPGANTQRPAVGLVVGGGSDSGLRAVLKAHCSHTAVDEPVLQYLMGALDDALEALEPKDEFASALGSFVDEGVSQSRFLADVAALVEERRREHAAVAAAQAPPMAAPAPLLIDVPPPAVAPATNPTSVAFPSKKLGAAKEAVAAAQEYDPCPYDTTSEKIDELVALGISVRRDIIARVLWGKCNGDLSAAATLLFEPDAEAKELAAIDAEIARRAAEVARVEADEKAKEAVRKRILAKYDEQEDRKGVVHRPHAAVGVRGVKVKKAKQGKRYFDGQVVSHTGEKYFMVDKAPKPVKNVTNYPETSGGSMKVLTKGKRGPGFRMA